MCVRACEKEAEEAEKKKGGREEEVRTKKTPIDSTAPPSNFSSSPALQIHRYEFAETTWVLSFM
jgi:hypothetical protein